MTVLTTFNTFLLSLGPGPPDCPRDAPRLLFSSFSRTGIKTRRSVRRGSKSAVMTHLPAYTCSVPDTHRRTARRGPGRCTYKRVPGRHIAQDCTGCYSTQVVYRPSYPRGVPPSSSFYPRGVPPSLSGYTRRVL